MARKNRVSVPDGIYHVTARIANRAMLLAKDEVKDKIMEWIVSVADFSGVEVWAFCIMDNHLHLFVRVPPVLERLWLAPDEAPDAHAFGMRPPECREPLWSPVGDSPRSQGASAGSLVGDSPSPRCPSLGFMLDDGEMIGRLVSLYGERRAAEIARQWEAMRRDGFGHLVDESVFVECPLFNRRVSPVQSFAVVAVVVPTPTGKMPVGPVGRRRTGRMPEIRSFVA